jgi:hypothetical protein
MRRLAAAGIIRSEVNPAFPSKLGNHLWADVLRVPDPAGAAVELGRRAIWRVTFSTPQGDAAPFPKANAGQAPQGGPPRGLAKRLEPIPTQDGRIHAAVPVPICGPCSHPGIHASPRSPTPDRKISLARERLCRSAAIFTHCACGSFPTRTMAVGIDG